MLDKYEEISSVQGNEDKELELFHLGQKAGLPDKLIDFLWIQDIKIKKKTQGSSDTLKQMKSSVYENFIFSKNIVIPETKYFSYKITRFFYRIAIAPMFSSFIFL